MPKLEELHNNEKEQNKIEDTLEQQIENGLLSAENLKKNPDTIKQLGTEFADLLSNPEKAPELKNALNKNFLKLNALMINPKEEITEKIKSSIMIGKLYLALQGEKVDIHETMLTDVDKVAIEHQKAKFYETIKGPQVKYIMSLSHNEKEMGNTMDDVVSNLSKEKSTLFFENIQNTIPGKTPETKIGRIDTINNYLKETQDNLNYFKINSLPINESSSTSIPKGELNEIKKSLPKDIGETVLGTIARDSKGNGYIPEKAKLHEDIKVKFPDYNDYVKNIQKAPHLTLDPNNFINRAIDEQVDLMETGRQNLNKKKTELESSISSNTLIAGHQEDEEKTIN